MMIENGTMIRISKKTTERLKERGKKGDTYDQIINRLLDEVERRERKE